MTKANEAERQVAIEELRNLLKPGDKLYTVLRRVSRSGMSRGVDVYLFKPNDKGETEKLFLTKRVAKIVGYRYTFEDWQQSKGLTVNGCGMDAGFEVVYNLGRYLFADNFICAGEHCPSNDHSNGDRDRTPHVHSDGGYALRQEWL